MFLTLRSSFCNGRATSALFHIRRANLEELIGDVDNDVSKWEALGTLAYGVSRNSGYLSRGSYDKDYRILGCLLLVRTKILKQCPTINLQVLKHIYHCSLKVSTSERRRATLSLTRDGPASIDPAIISGSSCCTPFLYGKSKP